MSNLASDPHLAGPARCGAKDHDLLAIDHRGIGASAAIDCPALQHVQGDQLDAARACGRASAPPPTATAPATWPTTSTTSAPRSASTRSTTTASPTARVDVRAYAYRHPDHLRAAVLDSPDFSTDDAFFRTLPGAMAKIAVRVCRARPPARRARSTRPDAAALSRGCARKPVTGTGFDADGKAHHVKVDEIGLLSILYDDYFADPAFLNQGELFAAAHAFDAGDKTPLLRLAAESNAPTDFGPRDGFAIGRRRLRRVLLRLGLPVGQVRAGGDPPRAVRGGRQGGAADRDRAVHRRRLDGVHRLPAGAADPGRRRVHAVAGPARGRSRRSRPAAVARRHARRCCIGGGLDYLDVAAERTLLPLFPAATPFVTVANGGHVTTLWSTLRGGHRRALPEHAAAGQHVVRGGHPRARPGTRSAARGRAADPGRRGFPRRAADAIPAKRDRTRHDDSTALARRVGAVAVGGGEDGVYQLPRVAGATGRGLRGGHVHGQTRRDAGHAHLLRRARFADDVVVSGTVTFVPATSRVSGRSRERDDKGVLDVSGRCGTRTSPARRCAERSAATGSRCSRRRAETSGSPTDCSAPVGGP